MASVLTGFFSFGNIRWWTSYLRLLVIISVCRKTPSRCFPLPIGYSDLNLLSARSQLSGTVCFVPNIKVGFSAGLISHRLEAVLMGHVCPFPREWGHRACEVGTGQRAGVPHLVPLPHFPEAGSTEACCRKVQEQACVVTPWVTGATVWLVLRAFG